MNRKVVVTGMGTYNPIGSSVKEFWENIQAGRSGVTRIDEQFPELKDYHVKIAAPVSHPVKEQHRKYFDSVKLLKRLDSSINMSIISSRTALLDSGLELDKEDDKLIGAVIGTGAGGLISHQKNITNIANTGMQSIEPFYVVNAIPNTISAAVCKELKIRGACFSVNSACASSNHSIGISSMLIASGQADIMFAGGSESPICLATFASFGILGALSTRNDDPSIASRPFDKDRDGFVIGAGAGILCLEEFEHARERGAHIYAEIKGYHFSDDAHDLVAPDPNASMSSYSMRQSIKNAGLNPEDIDLINCHGTSTPVGDKAESAAIHRVFGAHASKVAVHSTKSMVGHLLGAAGGVEAIAVILALEKGIVHPSINCFNQDPEIKLNVIKEARDDIRVRNVVSNGFGFGGHNAVVILAKV